METNGMKKSIFLKLSTFTFLMAGVVFCGCSNSNDEPIEPIEPVGPKTYTLTIEAFKGGNSMTRALTPGETSLVSTWETTDQVYVTKSGESSSCGSLQPNTSAETATLSGKITGTFTQGNELKFQYPREEIDYTEQDGTLESIAAKYDYSVATATVGEVGANTITVTGLSDFENQQAIVKFTLKDAYGYAVNATSLKVSAEGLKTSDSATGDITVNVPNSSATDVFYVALSGIIGKAVSLTATAATDTYVYEKSNVTFSNGKYYEITVKMKSAMLYEPLTFEAVNDETQISFHNPNEKSIWYRINSGDWINSTSTLVIGLTSGSKVSFIGDNESYSDEYFQCSSNNNVYVYGNIMSLVSSDRFAGATSLSDTYTFMELFMKRTSDDYQGNFLNHPNKELLLPATTLMSNCYQSMFQGCTGLTRAPVLPAATLVSGCYNYMFMGCANLNYIKCLAKEIPDGCTTNWVEGVQTISGTFVSADGVNWPDGDSGNPW